jgi:hypothetical protein
MVATRRSASHGDRRNVANSNSPPPNPPTVEQALMVQTQLLQTFIQNALNNPHQEPLVDKCGEFMKGHPLTFSHTSDPLEADD